MKPTSQLEMTKIFVPVGIRIYKIRHGHKTNTLMDINT